MSERRTIVRKIGGSTAASGLSQAQKDVLESIAREGERMREAIRDKADAVAQEKREVLEKLDPHLRRYAQ